MYRSIHTQFDPLSIPPPPAHLHVTGMCAKRCLFG